MAGIGGLLLDAEGHIVARQALARASESQREPILEQGGGAR